MGTPGRCVSWGLCEFQKDRPAEAVKARGTVRLHQGLLKERPAASMEVVSRFLVKEFCSESRCPRGLHFESVRQISRTV